MHGEKYDLTLKQLLDLSYNYFDKQIHGNLEESESLTEYNDREKSLPLKSQWLLHEMRPFPEGLRLIESKTNSYEENNEDLIRDLKLRMSIQSGGDKMCFERPNSGIVNRINDIIQKYS